MRKVLNISVAVLLFFASVGMSTTSHYCGDFLMEVVMGHQKDLSCCGMMNCCSNEVTQFQLGDDLQVSLSEVDLSTSNTFYFSLPWQPVVDYSLLGIAEQLINQQANAPPPASAPPIYLRVAAFLC